jgi:hypothetical protein
MEVRYIECPPDHYPIWRRAVALWWQCAREYEAKKPLSVPALEINAVVEKIS